MRIQGTPLAVIGDDSDTHRLVRESDPLPVGLFDGAKNPIGSLNGAINVHDADVHQEMVNKLFNEHTGIETTLTVAVVGGDVEWEISVADATGFSVGDSLHLNTGNEETTHPVITAISAATGPSVFTLDRRLDVSHDIGDAVELANVNMVSANGTMAAPIVYFVAPGAGEVWHLTRFLFEITHDTAGDLGKFGGATTLTNGFVVRTFVAGEYRTFSSWKRAGEIKRDMFDVDFDARSGGQGVYGTSGRGTFKKLGSVVRLDGDTGDRLEFVCQDTVLAQGNNTFTMKAQGHPEAS